MDIYNILLIFILALSVNLHADEKLKCTLEIEGSTSKITQKPLKSSESKKVKKGESVRFDFTGTLWKCEYKHYGKDNGTFINCWSPDYKMGLRSDLTTYKNKDAHKVPNTLTWVSTSSDSVAKIDLSCK